MEVFLADRIVEMKMWFNDIAINTQNTTNKL